MLIDVTRLILDPFGQPVINAGQELTLRHVLVDALLTPLKGDEDLAAVEKTTMFALAMKVVGRDQVDMSVEDRNLAKQRVGRACTNLVVGRVFEIIDPPSFGSLKPCGKPSDNLPYEDD